MEKGSSLTYKGAEVFSSNAIQKQQWVVFDLDPLASAYRSTFEISQRVFISKDAFWSLSSETFYFWNSIENLLLSLEYLSRGYNWHPENRFQSKKFYD